MKRAMYISLRMAWQFNLLADSYSVERILQSEADLLAAAISLLTVGRGMLISPVLAIVNLERRFYKYIIFLGGGIANAEVESIEKQLHAFKSFAVAATTFPTAVWHPMILMQPLVSGRGRRNTEDF